MNARSVIGWGLVAIVAAAYAAAYYRTLTTFRGETSAAPMEFGQAGRAEPGHVLLDINILEVNPQTQEITARIVPEARGTLLAKDGTSLAQPLVMDIQGGRASFGSTLAEGQSEVSFAQGKVMAPLDVTLMLGGGSVDSYPFDEYRVPLHINLSRPDKKSPTGFAAVPVCVRLSLGVAGYKISAAEEPALGDQVGRDGKPETKVDTVQLELSVARSATSFWFAAFLMGVVLLLSLACALVAVWVLVLGRKIEPQFFTWMAGTLFAIVGLRNVLPGNPPLGALPDFLAFIWAESLVALALLCIVGVYLARKPR